MLGIIIIFLIHIHALETAVILQALLRQARNASEAIFGVHVASCALWHR